MAEHTIETEPVRNSADLRDAFDGLMDEAHAWIDHCLAAYGDAEATDVHDQGTYTTCWEPALRLRPRDDALAFLTTTRDRIADHFHARDKWRHGYWRMQEAHHGTEHFELFLGSLWRLQRDTDDTAIDATVHQIADMAEHLGNWSGDVEPWFDWDTGLLRSAWFGADGLDKVPPELANVPDHLRCANIALLAWEATGDQRYRALAAAHVSRWADGIVTSEHVPAMIAAHGPLAHVTEQQAAQHRAVAGQSSAADDDLGRAENILASNGLETLLRLWQITGDTPYRDAARRLLDALLTQIYDVDAAAAVHMFRLYRQISGDTRYDPAFTDLAAKLEPFSFEMLTLELGPKLDAKPHGVGKRADMPTWREDDRPRRHHPVTLAYLAELTGDETLARRALDLATTYLTLARRMLPDGRHHGCAARTVSAVARGHGRDNNTGVITGVLEPIAHQFDLRNDKPP